jgi:NAD-dependent SIR2 family protein deacetylase
MDFTCPDCGHQFTEEQAIRDIGRFRGHDAMSCPKCENKDSNGEPQKKPTRSFMPTKFPPPQIGVQLSGQRDQTPSQIAWEKLQNIANKLDKNGFTKLADQIDQSLLIH